MTSHDARAHAAACRIPGDHPALSGHFPGNPVVPGVLLLDRVIDAAEAWLGRRLRVRGLRHAKFLAPLAPGDDVRIELALAGDALEFSIRRDAATVAKGSIVLAGTSGP
jgi:3-hydroxymyristoyl/3-hydroxydecanoyl-(acyl carrier protein) dehydratase